MFTIMAAYTNTKGQQNVRKLKMIENFEIIHHRLIENGCSHDGYKPGLNALQVWNTHGQDEWIDATIEGVENYLAS